MWNMLLYCYDILCKERLIYVGCLALLILFFVVVVMVGTRGILFFVALILLGVIFTQKDKKKYENTIKHNREKTHEKIIEEFRPDKIICDYKVLGNDAIYINNFRKQILFVNLLSTIRVMYYFDELIECSIVENGIARKSGGVGQTRVGCIVGSSQTSSLYVRIFTKNVDMPLYTVLIIADPMIRNTSEYQHKIEMAEEIYATIISIIKR